MTINSELVFFFGITRRGLGWCLHALLCRRPVAEHNVKPQSSMERAEWTIQEVLHVYPSYKCLPVNIPVNLFCKCSHTVADRLNHGGDHQTGRRHVTAAGN